MAVETSYALLIESIPHMIENSYLNLLTTSLILILYMLWFRDFYIACTINSNATLEDVNKRKKRAFCDNCNITKTDKIHHCKSCNKCVYKLDHHCIFLA